MTSILFFANTDWYLYNYRFSLIRAAREAGAEVRLMSPAGKHTSRFVEQGFGWRELPLDRWGKNPLNDLRMLSVCAAEYRRIRPDLVHHFTIKPVIYGSLAARLTRVPAVVNSITGLGTAFGRGGSTGRLLLWLLKKMFRLAFQHKRMRVIFQNSYDREEFVSQGLLTEEKALVGRGSGVDLDLFRPGPEPEGRPVILLAGRMLWEKGIAILVEAAKRLKERGIRAKVILAGLPEEGNPWAIPESRLQEWQRSGLIEWRGMQEDMPAIYRQSHIVALPTYYREGIPRSLIEAAAMGKPLVASDIPGCREIVCHGRNGFLVPARDPEALSKALARLILDPQLRRQMGMKSRELALERFNDQMVNGRILSLYEELLAQVGGQFGSGSPGPGPIC